jgi:hypothetical protein
MPIQVIALKLDFKMDNSGILRIVDIGDGFGADVTGFEAPEAKMLSDIHEATGASIATLFGELPVVAMYPDTINIPLVLRQPASAGSSFDTNDLPSDHKILPYSQQGRLASYLSHVWAKQKHNTLVAPAGLVASEMYKAFWYFLMQKNMVSDKHPKVLFWSNDTNPTEINLDSIYLRHGVFIKIADRSIGGAGEVFYASNKAEILKITADLHEKYNNSIEQLKKHLFIIEAAYVTIKQYQNVNYNVTGRAFVTVIYDQDKQVFDVKIAAAKWMFPLEPLQKEHTAKQMISNIKHHIKMESLSAKELKKLSAELQQTYRKTFEAGIGNIDFFEYFKDHPNIEQLQSCIRPNAVYIMMLKTYYRSEYNMTKGQEILEESIATLICRDSLVNFNSILTVPMGRLFASVPKSDTYNQIKIICTFSLFESYVAHLKASNSSMLMIPQLAELARNEPLIKSKLNLSISQLLTEKNMDYDSTDFNLALCQAAFFGDITVVKILIYTHRANVNALSPSNKTPLDYAQTCKNDDLKKNVIKLLGHVNAKTGEELSAAQTEEKRPTLRV